MDTSAEMKFRIIYDGSALQNHLMDAKDLAPALLAMSEIIDFTGKQLYGPKTKMSVKVNAAFKSGSFGIDFNVASFIQDTIIFINSGGVSAAKTILELLGLSVTTSLGLIGFIKWIRNRKITKIEPIDDKYFKIYVGDKYEKIDARVLELYRNHKIRKSLEKIVKKPLENDGIDEFASTSDKKYKNFVTVTKEESVWFSAPEQEENIEYEYTAEMLLTLDEIKFDNKKQWLLSYGGMQVKALIEDDTFLGNIDKRELSFAKGDCLRAIVNMKQFFKNGKLETTYTIEKVIEVVIPEKPNQIDLL